MLNISKVEVWSLLNILREIRDGSEPVDLEADVLDMIDMLESILDTERMDVIGRNGNNGDHYV